jgi:hypothetical protein
MTKKEDTRRRVANRLGVKKCYHSNPKYRMATRARAKKWREENPVKSQQSCRLATFKQRLREFKVPVWEWIGLVAKQGGVCAICRKPSDAVSKNGRTGSRLSIDHDHETGNIRGLLCRKCNLGLGNFGDDTDLLLAAVNYLTPDLKV